MIVATERPDFDVAIVGGGPAGSSMAAYLARAGVRCVVLEKELFPRPHVGESLVPSSTRVFKELDFLPVMEEAGFPHKYGAAWTAEHTSRVYDMSWEGLCPNAGADIEFVERAQAGVDQDYTYHVDRAVFDTLLLQHAHGFGAAVHEGVNVTRVEHGPDEAAVRFRLGERELRLTASVVVDASGRRTLTGSQNRWRIRDDIFDQYALHSWFEGFDRLAMASRSDQQEYIFIHFLPLSNTWIWQIPITDTVTSIGVVTQKKRFAASRADRERFFWECVESRPALTEALRASRQIRPLKEEGDYSYAMTRITDDRLMLVGDAARFVDPIFSTGVSIALSCSRFGHTDILRALETGDFSRQAFRPYESTIRRGTRNWYNFIAVYYRLNVLFTAFVNHPRHRLDVLKLLQGDVYEDEEPEVLTEMRRIVSEVEREPAHIWHDLLGDLTANAFLDAAQN